MAKHYSALPLWAIVTTPLWLSTGGTVAGELATESEDLPSGEIISESPFDVRFGINLTSDYISRGVTNSDSLPALQGYIEPTLFDLAYLNVWSSTVNFGEGFQGAEIEVSAGVKQWDYEYFDFDLGYIHYFYSPKDLNPDYGEIFGRGMYYFPKFASGAEIWFAPDYNQTETTATYVEGGIEVPFPTGIPWLSEGDLSVTGALGYHFFQDPNESEYLTWNVGVSYEWKNFTFDVRYSDTNLSDEGCIIQSGFADGCNARIVGSISFDVESLREFAHPNGAN